MSMQHRFAWTRLMPVVAAATALARASAWAAAGLATAAIMIFMTIACEREARPFDALSRPAARTGRDVTQSELHPGGGPAPVSSQDSPFRQNAWGMAEGKRLYQAYNCSGCHANGGGGMGPPLMDDRWIYGAAPANICLLYTSPSPRDGLLSRMPSSA